ncbi:RNA-directed DNA polymerase, eukaryota [Tanacetum coccineum]
MGDRFGFVRFLNVLPLESMKRKLSEIRIGNEKIVINVAKYEKKRIIKNNPKPNAHVSHVGFNNDSLWKSGRSYKDLTTPEDHDGKESGNEMEVPKSVVSAINIQVKEEVCKRFKKCMVADVKNFEILQNIWRTMKEEGIGECNIRYIGGLSILIECRSETAAQTLLQNCPYGLTIWLHNIRPWCEESVRVTESHHRPVILRPGGKKDGKVYESRTTLLDEEEDDSPSDEEQWDGNSTVPDVRLSYHEDEKSGPQQDLHGINDMEHITVGSGYVATEVVPNLSVDTSESVKVPDTYEEVEVTSSKNNDIPAPLDNFVDPGKHGSLPTEAQSGESPTVPIISSLIFDQNISPDDAIGIGHCDANILHEQGQNIDKQNMRGASKTNDDEVRPDFRTKAFPTIPLMLNQIGGTVSFNTLKEASKLNKKLKRQRKVKDALIIDRKNPCLPNNSVNSDNSGSESNQIKEIGDCLGFVNIQGNDTVDGGVWVAQENMIGLQTLSNQSMWGRSSCNFCYGGAVGQAGGTLLMWNTDCFTKEGTFSGNYFSGVWGRWVGVNMHLNIINVYGPQLASHKEYLWKDLLHLKDSAEDGYWIFLGDFNAVRDRAERAGSRFNESEAIAFNSFIAQAGLLDCQLGGRRYTYFNRQGSKMSKLDRFLICDNFHNYWPNVTVTALDRVISDHAPILLTTGDEINFGPKPFRVFDSWVNADDFDLVAKNS